MIDTYKKTEWMEKAISKRLKKHYDQVQYSDWGYFRIKEIFNQIDDYCSITYMEYKGKRGIYKAYH